MRKILDISREIEEEKDYEEIFDYVIYNAYEPKLSTGNEC